jgi:hypothetical protein
MTTDKTHIMTDTECSSSIEGTFNRLVTEYIVRKRIKQK